MISLTFSRHSLVVALAFLCHAVLARSATPQKSSKMPAPNSLERFLLAFNPASAPRASSAWKSGSSSMSLNPTHYSNTVSLFANTRTSESAQSISQQQSQSIAIKALGYSKELEKSLEDIHGKRKRLDHEILKREEDKAKSLKEFARLQDRLLVLDESIEMKSRKRNEYDATLRETEAAYSHILKSSQDLLHTLKRETVSLSSQKEDTPSMETFSSARPTQKKKPPRVANAHRKPGSYGAPEDLQAMFKKERPPNSVDTAVSPYGAQKKKATDANRKPGSYGSPQDIKEMFKDKMIEIS